MELTCQHCGYVWDYKGKKRFYAQCPNCRVNVNIRKARSKL